jgi:hypothetical protein
MHAHADAGNSFVKDLLRAAAVSALVLTGLAGSSLPVVDAGRWMTEDAMRTAFIGGTLDGHYVDGLGWSESYTADGRLDYREAQRKGLGYWYFRDHVFCTFYDPGQGLSGGCWQAIKVSSNCYEFYFAGLGGAEKGDEVAPGPLGSWAARAWRTGEPPTCEDRPTV